MVVPVVVVAAVADSTPVLSAPVGSTVSSPLLAAPLLVPSLVAGGDVLVIETGPKEVEGESPSAQAAIMHTESKPPKPNRRRTVAGATFSHRGRRR